MDQVRSFRFFELFFSVYQRNDFALDVRKTDKYSPPTTRAADTMARGARLRKGKNCQHPFASVKTVRGQRERRTVLQEKEAVLLAMP